MKKRAVKDEIVRARISTDLKKKLARFAENRELSESDVIRLALKKFLPNSNAKNVQI